MNTAFVKIWGELVGAVAWDEKTGLASFEYDTKFKKLNWELSPLKMPSNASKKIFVSGALHNTTAKTLIHLL
jgi:serine/threonine-protein kinase HipA